MAFIGLLFLSIEDIGVQIEEPFAILPLELHTRWLDRDAEQMKRLVRWSSDTSCRSSSDAATSSGRRKRALF